MINNRQAGRRRGRGGQRSQGGGQGGGGHGRPDNGSRIDNRARGNANQLYEKYKNLASDAQRQGDRVNTEYYLQFADHYFRVLNENRSRFEEQQPRQQARGAGDDQFDEDEADGNDFGDYGDEGEAIRPGEMMAAPAPQQQQQRPEREERGERRRFEERRPRRAEQPRDDRAGNGQADDRQADDRQAGDRQAGNAQAEVAPVAAAPAEQPVAPIDVEAPAPRRRGRPRKVDVADAAPADGGDALEADRLPPALGLPPVANDADAPGEKPRRRRRTGAAAEVPAAE